MLLEAANADPRPVAWVPLTASDDDPTVLLERVTDALAAIEPIPARTRAQILATTVDFNSVRLPRLRRLLAERIEPFVLVLDDVHRLVGDETVTTLSVILEAVPDGSQVMFGTRDGTALRLGALRARPSVCVLDATDLTMTLDEAAELLRRAGLDVKDDVVEVLVERTEGWPVGLYLAAVALRDEPDVDAAAAAFAGDDRVVVDYLRDELLALLSDEITEFLVATSILEVLSGGVCDALLATEGSAQMLEVLEQSNLLVMPLDRTRASSSATTRCCATSSAACCTDMMPRSNACSTDEPPIGTPRTACTPMQSCTCTRQATTSGSTPWCGAPPPSSWAVVAPRRSKAGCPRCRPKTSRDVRRS